MKGERTLIDKPFRYGGIMRNYDMTAEQWGEMMPKFMSRCYICGGRMENIYSPSGQLLHKTYPYVGVFKITKGKEKGLERFRTMCRSCAYKFGRGVIERDGHTYTDKYKFSESKFKLQLERGICYNCKHLKRHNGELAEYVCDIKGAVVSDTRRRECDDMWEAKERQ